MKNLKVVIVGSGIGGLTSALALASDGHEVTVLEGAQKFEDVFIKEVLQTRGTADSCATRSELVFVCHPTRRD